MRRLIFLSLIVSATISSTLAAQTSMSAPDGSLAGTREVGLFPMGRMLSRAYSVENSRLAYGGTATFGTQLRSYLAVQGGLGVAYGKQEFTYYRPPLFVFTPTLSLIIQQPTTHDFQPYVLMGAGYEFIRYTRARCDCDQSKSLGIGNIGAGFRQMIGDRRAFRAELSSQLGKGGPAFTGFAGMSFFLGGPTVLRRNNTPRPPDRVRVEPVSIPVPQTSRPGTAQGQTPQRNSTPRAQPAPVTVPPRTAPVTRPPVTLGDANGVLLTIDGTQVDFSKPAWRDETEPILDGLVVDLTSDAGQSLKLRVEAHTDNVGASAANIILALDRARAVRDYLVSQGVAADRIQISSAGEDDPIAPNTTALGRQQNRRIVIRREN